MTCWSLDDDDIAIEITMTLTIKLILPPIVIITTIITNHYHYPPPPSSSSPLIIVIITNHYHNRHHHHYHHPQHHSHHHHHHHNRNLHQRFHVSATTGCQRTGTSRCRRRCWSSPLSTSTPTRASLHLFIRSPYSSIPGPGEMSLCSDDFQWFKIILNTLK